MNISFTSSSMVTNNKPKVAFGDNANFLAEARRVQEWPTPTGIGLLGYHAKTANLAEPKFREKIVEYLTNKDTRQILVKAIKEFLKLPEDFLIHH